jgi:hypothetical protein
MKGTTTFEEMVSARYIPVMTALLTALCMGCLKDADTGTGEAPFRLSVDTLRFDTLFATTGSPTAGFVILNPGRTPLRIEEVRLSGGSASSYRINADGVSGPVAGPFDIAGGDSLHVFVTVGMPTGPSPRPFLVSDSIRIRSAGREGKVVLEAFGQNARFLRNVVLGRDTRFNDSLPYVVLGTLQVAANATLTLERGTRMYMHADAPILVDGRLVAEGEPAKPVLFTGDRLDEGYRDLPGSWPGIYFRATSTGNRLSHAIVRNAYNGLAAEQPDPRGGYKLTLRQCTIDNASEAGILAIASSVDAVNCLVLNCGGNIALGKGGDHRFIHCTVASYSNRYLQHKSPVLVATDWDSTRTGLTFHPLSADFTNCILWGSEGGVDNEAVVSRRGSAAFRVSFRNCLYRGTDPVSTLLADNLRNVDPRFDSIDIAKRHFDLRIQRRGSPAVDKGLAAGSTADIEGKPRDARPDIGCHERQ